jgi:hypothetical protein
MTNYGYLGQTIEEKMGNGEDKEVPLIKGMMTHLSSSFWSWSAGSLTEESAQGGKIPFLSKMGGRNDKWTKEAKGKREMRPN